MKKLLLAIALFGIALPHSAAAEARTAQTKRKKSKEIALIKAIAGTYIAAHNANQFLALLIQPFIYPEEGKELFFYSRKMQTRASFILSIIGALVARKGLNDLDEIEQYE